MTTYTQVTDALPRAHYAANGVQTAFPFTFPVFDAEDMEVWVNDSLQLQSAYSVSGIGVAVGGTVIFTVPPPPSTTVTLRRRMALKRTSEFPDTAVEAKPLNDALYYQMAALQQVADDNSLAVKRSFRSLSSADLTLPDPAAGRAIKWAADGLSLVNSDQDPDAQVDAAASAGIATTQAGIATAQASIATTKAADASASAAAAAGSAAASRGAVRMYRTGNSSNSGGGSWAVFGPDGTPINIAGSASQGLQEAIDHAQRYGYDLIVHGGSYAPMVWGVPYGGSLGSNPLTTAGGSRTVVVALQGHGLASGKHVILAGLSATNGIPAAELNALHTVSVIDADHISVTVPVTSAVSSGTGGGGAGTYQHNGVDVSIIYCTAPINLTPFEKMTADFGAVSIIFAPSVLGDGLVIDTALMADIRIGGQIGYCGNGSAVALRPRNNLPLSGAGQYACVNSRLQLTSVSLYGASPASATCLHLDATYGDITGCIISAVELNGNARSSPTPGIGMKVTPSASHGVYDNVITLADVHGCAVGLDLGGAAANAALVYGNHITATIDPAASGIGVKDWGDGNILDLTITDAEGTPATGIYWGTSATRGIVRCAINRAANPVADASASKSNRIIGPRVHVEARLAAPQTITHATATKVALATETWDTIGSYNNATYDWTPPAGLVQIAAAVEYTAATDPSPITIFVYKNGAVWLEVRQPASGAYAQGPQIVAVDMASGSDAYAIYTRQDSGADKTLQSVGYATKATFTYVG